MIRKIRKAARLIKDSAIEPIAELAIIGYVLFLVSAYLPWFGNILINHIGGLIIIAFVYLGIKSFFKARHLRLIDNKIDKETKAIEQGRYKELCEEILLLAEYNIDIATKNMNTYRVLSISSIVAMVFSQVVNIKLSFDGLERAYFELVENKNQIQSLQVINISPAHIVAIIFVLLILYSAFQYHRNSVRYNNWRYDKFDYSAKLATYKEAPKSDLSETLNRMPI